MDFSDHQLYAKKEKRIICNGASKEILNYYLCSLNFLQQKYRNYNLAKSVLLYKTEF